MRNKLMTLNMAFTCILFIALMTSVPLYTDGVLQSMLINELESFQIERNVFPGSVTIRSDYGFYKGGREAHQRVFNRVDNYINDTFLENTGLPIIERLTFHQTRSGRIEEDLRTRDVPDREFHFRFTYISELFDNVEITSGRLPSDKLADGKYEAIISEETMYVRHISLGDEFIINHPGDDERQSIHIVIVGAFRPMVRNELLYMFADISGQNESVFFHESLFEEAFLSNFFINDTIWYLALDYHAIDVYNILNVLESSLELEEWISDRGFNSVMPITRLLPIFQQYREELIPLLFSLYAPIIIMLLFYLFMVSSMIVDKQKNEIAVMKSRGAGRLQLIFGYFVESLIYGFIGLAFGPLLGILLTRILGSTTGFMEFVNRTALEVELNHIIYIYALVGTLLAVLAILLPVYNATRTDILEHKKKTSRFAGIPFWKKYFIDILALAIAVYGLYQFDLMRQDLVAASDIRLSIDPMLFVISTLFVMGVGLLFIRIFPIIIELIYRIGKKHWPLTMYSSLIQVARSIHSYQFLMIFIILTVATAIFSSTAARTINQNAHERVRYHGGADHVLMAHWRIEGIQLQPAAQGQPVGPVGQEEQESPQGARYIEPSFHAFTELAGVQSATKVLNSVGRIHHTAGSETVRVMGIEPREFGLTAWFPKRLLPFHWFHHLNSLSHSQSMVLISRSLAERANLNPWDVFSMHWDPNGRADFMVAGIIDYWPTWNPNHTLDIANNRFDALVVAHIEYLQANASLRPYEVWLNMKSGASTYELYDDMRNSGIRLERISDTEQQLIALSRDPIHLGVNGSLTLVFIISILITFSGFMLFWLLAVNSRLLQAGVMMAMGIRLKELVAMTIWEQVLTSVIPMIFGVITGGITATLFIPVLQISFSAVEQVPPFRSVSYSGDYINIYIILGSLILIGLATVSYLLSNLKIYSCIKLGED